MLIPIAVAAASVNIQVLEINYNVDSLETATSDARTFDYDHMRYTSSWSKVLTDMTSGYYTTITTQKKVAFIYTNKDSLKILNPSTTKVTTRTVNNIGSGTYRYKIYNWSMWSTGTIKVNFTDQAYNI